MLAVLAADSLVRADRGRIANRNVLEMRKEADENETATTDQLGGRRLNAPREGRTCPTCVLQRGSRPAARQVPRVLTAEQAAKIWAALPGRGGLTVRAGRI